MITSKLILQYCAQYFKNGEDNRNFNNACIIYCADVIMPRPHGAIGLIVPLCLLMLAM